VFDKVLTAQEKASKARPILAEPKIRRIIMKSRITKLAAAAVIIVGVALSLTVIDKLMPEAYAIDQTVKAFKNERFIHLVRRDEADQVKDERWIELGMDGRQVRYRQDKHGESFAIEDGESTAVYHHDKKTVAIYDRKDKQYQWIGNLGEFLENLLQKGKIIKENDDYYGQPAHRVWWPMAGAECFVDPETKLPIAIGDMEMSYVQPPAGTFEIVIPQGYAIVDLRPGRETGPIPEWLQDKKIASKRFNEATHALARGNYAEAAELFEYVVEHQSGRNWAWFWLGSSYYQQGQYQLAIDKFNKVFEIFGDNSCHYCNYYRGLAYAQIGMDEAAQQDLQVCLPLMLSALRETSAAAIFEYADHPLLRYGKYKPSEQQIVTNMINRLRIITDQNFGYDPDGSAEENEAAIAAWEEWYENSGEIKVTPDAELVRIPEVVEEGVQ
ncbi:MAG: tetratricopeptide repeat protein, partial [Planctomycetota bacterium]|jgi:tetratricopeptide (TPR) repeat protein